MKNNRGQMQLSFGMIFSIILIIIFVSVAFFAIKTFLGLQDSSLITKFVKDLNSDIDRIWKSSQSSQTIDYMLPKEVTHVCFVDFSKESNGTHVNLFNELKRGDFGGGENFVFYPIGSSEVRSTKIDKINLHEMTIDNNPLCFRAVNQRIEFTFVKNYGEALVNIK